MFFFRDQTDLTFSILFPFHSNSCGLSRTAQVAHVFQDAVDLPIVLRKFVEL